MSQYKDGTASVNNNSNIVTGSGTLWLANISAGDLFTKVGDDVAYTVAGVTNNTILTLTAPYSGSSSSGSNYGITIGFTAGGLPLLSAGDLNTAAIYSEAMKGIDNNAVFKSQLTSSSATIFDNGNLNVTIWDCNGANANLLPRGYVANTTTGATQLEVNKVGKTNIPTTMVFTGSLSVIKASTGSVLGVLTSADIQYIPSASTSRDIFIQLNNITGATAGDVLLLRSVDATSKLELIY